MQYVMFIYNVLLIMLFAMDIACYIVYYLRTKKTAYLWVAAMFLLFIGENLILHMADLLESFQIFYNLHTLSGPLLKTGISIGIFVCYMVLAAKALEQKPALQDWATLGIFTMALLLVPLLAGCGVGLVTEAALGRVFLRGKKSANPGGAPPAGGEGAANDG